MKLKDIFENRKQLYRVGPDLFFLASMPYRILPDNPAITCRMPDIRPKRDYFLRTHIVTSCSVSF